MTGSIKDVYVYLECNSCEDIFRMLISSYNNKLRAFCEYDGGFVICPACSVCAQIVNYKRVNRKKWKKSNEVKPNNVIEKGQLKISAG